MTAWVLTSVTSHSPPSTARRCRPKGHSSSTTDSSSRNANASYHTLTTRCQEHGKTSIHHRLDDNEGRFTEWVLHRLSRAVVKFAEQFSTPVIAFEDISGIREEINYGTYMNRRLYKLLFNKFEKFVSYKATWREVPTDTVDAYDNSQTCSCCGEHGYRHQ